MREQAIVNEALIAISKIPGVRAWRQNTGSGVGYGIVRAAIGHIDAGRHLLAAKILKSSRPVTYGVSGQADVSGILADGRRLEVELKTATGKQAEQQKKWERMIKAHGGVYILARSADEAADKVMQLYDSTEGLERDINQLEDYIRWLEFKSGQGDVGLTREIYEREVLDGQWDQGVGE